MYDYVIRNGFIVDGSGLPAYKGDLAIADGRIAAVGSVRGDARQVIDAAGKVVAPGFIDIQLFRDWDGNLSTASPQAAVYEVFIRSMILHLTRPKLGELAPRYAGKGPTPVLAEGSIFGEHSREWLMTVLSDPQSPWWDTGEGRNHSELIHQAMQDTVATLQKLCGPRMEDWAWGKLHNLTFGHPLGSVKPLDSIFNRGPYPVGGDGDTIWASVISSTDLQGRDIVGPPFRFIADLSDWNKSLGMLVPGQSGHPASEHYDDNITGFFKGEYHPMLFDREQVTPRVTSNSQSSQDKLT